MNIVIVEDQRRLLSYYTMLLSGDPGIGKVTPCTTLKEAIQVLQHRNVDILTTNLGNPVTRGIERIKTIRRRYPEVEILVLSSNDDETVVLETFRSGATGYLLKGAPPAELVEAIYAIHRGGVPLTPKIARMLIRHLHQKKIITNTPLTTRELKVLKLMEQGLTYKEIGATLCISTHLVHSQVKKIHSKLKAYDRKDAFKKARKQGLI